VQKLSCIGSGNMGAALMKAAAKNAEVYFTDTEKEKAVILSEQFAQMNLNAGVLDSNTEAAQKGDFVFLAVKPQVLSDVLCEIAPALRDRHIAANAPVMVSMAAGWSIAKIQSVIGEKVPVARLMPNTPSLIGKGMIALAVSPEVTADKLDTLKIILNGAGIVDILEEHYMDAVTGLSGSGPAFVYLFIDALADGGLNAGLPKEKALFYAAQTVLGSAAMVLETQKQPNELKDMVTSPNGTTIAGLNILERDDFSGTVIKAVEAAWKRSIELGEA